MDLTGDAPLTKKPVQLNKCCATQAPLNFYKFPLLTSLVIGVTAPYPKNHLGNDSGLSRSDDDSFPLYFALLAQRYFGIQKIYLICDSGSQLIEDDKLALDFGIPTISLYDALHQVDLLIEFSWAIPLEAAYDYRARGGVLVEILSHFGNAIQAQGQLESSRDARWIMHKNQHFNTSIKNDQFCNPLFDLEAFQTKNTNLTELAGLEESKNKGWLFAVVSGYSESSLHNLEYSLHIIDAVYQENLTLINHVYLFGSHNIALEPPIAQMALGTSLGIAKKITSESNYPSAEILGIHANALFATYDLSVTQYHHYWAALLGGYPLIHSCENFKDAGYYLNNDNKESAKRMISDALLHHAENLLDYRSRSLGLSWDFSIKNIENQHNYYRLLSKLDINRNGIRRFNRDPRIIF